MMLRIALIATLFASPAFAAVAGKPFFSLYNTDLIVLVAFVIFVGVLIYYKVPGRVTGILDDRASTIKSELDEARRLREEALELHASFERKQAEVKDKAARIVEKAKADAQIAADETKAEIEASIERRLKAAEEQIASAEAAALRQVRDRAAAVAVSAAGDIIAKNMDDARSDQLIADATEAAGKYLH